MINKTKNGTGTCIRNSIDEKIRTIIKPELIPSELKIRQQWILFKAKLVGERLNKYPVTVRNRRKGWNLAENQSCFEIAYRTFTNNSNYSGIGYAITENDPYTCIDFDHVYNLTTEELNQQALEEIKKLNSYTEFSPSGTGVHVFIIAKMKKAGTKKEQPDGTDREVYSGRHYMTVTGNHVPGTPLEINEAQGAINELYEKWFPDQMEVPARRKASTDDFRVFEVQKSTTNNPNNRLKGLRPTKGQVIELCKGAPGGFGEKFNKVFNGDISKYASKSEADMALAGMIAFHTSDYGIIKEIIHESALWDNKWERDDYCQRTIMTAIRNRWGEIIMSNKEMVVPGNGVQMPYLHDPNKYMIDGKFNPKLMADALLSEFHFFTYAETESIFVYEDGIYKPIGIHFIKKEMLERLGKYFRVGQVSEVTAQIKIQKMVDIDEINSDRHLINLNNGIFDTKERKFKEHDPSFLCTIRIPATYDHSAKCAIINRFLDDVVSPKGKQTLLEWSGLMLIPEVKFEKAMMLCGSGGNGKSTFLNLLNTLIGKENTTAIPLQKLIDEKNNRFVVAHLFEKLMNVCADIPSTTIHNSHMFKLLVGKDKITGEHKFGHPFEFYNTARLIFSARILPNISEIDDEAYFRRWLIVEFPNRFTGEFDDKDMQDKLTTDAELSGFLNLALNGLETILKNGRFTHELSIKETADQYITKANPVYKFSEKCIVSSPNDISKDDVYVEYLKWCEQNNEKPVPNNTFGKKMKDLDYMSIQKGDQKYYWEGIAIKKQ